MFKKLTTFAKIRLVISAVWLILFCFRTDYDWYNILMGYLLCASLRIVSKFVMKSANTKLDELTTQIEAKNNQK